MEGEHDARSPGVRSWLIDRHHAGIRDIEAVPGTHVVWAVGIYKASDGGNRPLFDITVP